MDLLARTLILAVILIAIIFGVYYALQNSVFQHVTQQQAASLVTSDLQRLYPSALINITNNTPSNYSGSWHVVASVVLNSTSVCPSYFVYTFDYPQFGFVYRVDNTYTSNCVVYGLSNKSFIISSFPVAVTRAYTLGIPAVKAFVEGSGFSNVVTHANFFNYTDVQGSNYTNVWIVNYSSPEKNYTLYVALSQLNGTLLKTFNISSS
ncbi:MAG: hypothetical protein M1286_03420 [Candidatus Marsarchaeota archaeon]|nr:hypothetical protein [Candidatus Marsarchaeota archaeon]